MDSSLAVSALPALAPDRRLPVHPPLLAAGPHPLPARPLPQALPVPPPRLSPPLGPL